MSDSELVCRKLKGNVGAPGLVVGLAYCIDRAKLRVTMRLVLPELVLLEKSRFRDAIEKSRAQLDAALGRDLQEDHRLILEAHLAWLADEYMIQEVMRHIETDRINAEWAVKKLFDGLKATLAGESERTRIERTQLFDEVAQRLIRNLMGVQDESLDGVPPGVVIVAHNISPGDMAHIDRERVVGLATDLGGPTSHSSILARGMELPAVVGLEHVTTHVKTGDVLILDAQDGLVFVHPGLELIDEYQEKIRKRAARTAELLEIKDLPCVTADGVPVGLQANIDLPEEMRLAENVGIRDIGLFRTEFIFLAKGGPASEEEQYEIYSRILREVGRDHYATIRTLDMGYDKVLPELNQEGESNPAMGLRAIRFCLQREDIFKDQLRAMLRASVHGNLRIMFPMISCLSELRRAKGILEEVRQELELEGREFSDDVRVGIMIEVPSAVIIADILAAEVDFFSIGTNDLIQYTMAIDRENENVAYLYSPIHQAILRMIRQTVDAAREAGIEVSMCGEMAGDLQLTMLLVGLGVDNLSMSPAATLKVKDLIRRIDMGEARALAERVLGMKTRREIIALVKDTMHTRFPTEFRDHSWTI